MDPLRHSICLRDLFLYPLPIAHCCSPGHILGFCLAVIQVIQKILYIKMIFRRHTSNKKYVHMFPIWWGERKWQFPLLKFFSDTIQVKQISLLKVLLQHESLFLLCILPHWGVEIHISIVALPLIHTSQITLILPEQYQVWKVCQPR